MSTSKAPVMLKLMEQAESAGYTKRLAKIVHDAIRDLDERLKALEKDKNDQAAVKRR